jgi:NADP-dependent 3-hydroxy acid dehydrogenase YdfG
MKNALKDKVVIVTGASSGIGRSVALQLGQAQAHVTLTARRTSELEQVKTQIEASRGQASVVACDLTDERQIIDMISASHAKWGRLDALVNAAGIGLATSIMDGSTEDWRRMFEVNVIGLAVASREALRRFDPRSGGHIVHVSSMAGHRIPPSGGMYAATKFAVRGLTEVMRAELRHAKSPVRVSAISPGLVDTEFFRHYHRGNQDKVDEVRSRYEKILEPEDVAASVLHILAAPPHVEIHDVLMRSTYQAT